MSTATRKDQLKVLARACQFCRSRKIKCDTVKPSCGSCVSQSRHCVYLIETPKRRPSTAIINKLQDEKRALENVIVTLKSSSGDQRGHILNSISVVDGSVHLPPYDISNTRKSWDDVQSPKEKLQTGISGLDLIPEADRVNDDGGDSDQDFMENVSIVSVGEEKQTGVFESTSVYQGPPVEGSAVKPQLGSMPGTNSSPMQLYNVKKSIDFASCMTLMEFQWNLSCIFSTYIGTDSITRFSLPIDQQ